MSLKTFFRDIESQVSAVADSSFEIEIIDTTTVPNFNDSSVTFDNFDSQKKKCKRLVSCVLYVDIRDSVNMSALKKPKTLTKIYSSFVKSMVECGKYFGGHVRNIIGDRVMVVFDQDDCFKNAVNTAVLMNTVCQKILNKKFSGYTDIQCGIGIDYGSMLITKTGTIKQGTEKEFYRSLVWLGRPANIASRLTDIAAKKVTTIKPAVQEGHYYEYLKEWGWYTYSHEDFINRLSASAGKITHESSSFKTFIPASSNVFEKTYSPIFMTKEVYDGYKAACPDDESIVNSWYTKLDDEIRDFSGDVYSGDILFKVIKEVMPES